MKSENIQKAKNFSGREIETLNNNTNLEDYNKILNEKDKISYHYKRNFINYKIDDKR